MQILIRKKSFYKSDTLMNFTPEFLAASLSLIESPINILLFISIFLINTSLKIKPFRFSTKTINF